MIKLVPVVGNPKALCTMYTHPDWYHFLEADDFADLAFAKRDRDLDDEDTLMVTVEHHYLFHEDNVKQSFLFVTEKIVSRDIYHERAQLAPYENYYESVRRYIFRPLMSMS